MKAFCLLVTLLAAGCASVGPKTIEPARYGYNEAAVHSMNEQLLLNLVRLRYNEAPYFMQLGSIVTQYSAGISAGINPSINENGSPRTQWGVPIGAQYTEAPTITFNPMQDEDFARSLLSPIPSRTLMLLSHSGWSGDRLMLCCVQRLNDVQNIPIASWPSKSDMPKYQRFEKLSDLFRDLQKEGLIENKIVTHKDGSQQDYFYIYSDTSSSPETKETIVETKRLLGLSPEKNEYPIVPAYVHTTGDALKMETRSLAGVLTFLSKAVQAPRSHIEEGRLTAEPEAFSLCDWKLEDGKLLTIYSCKEKPKFAYIKIYYRDHWFFVDDRDTSSKSTISLVNALFALQAAETKGQGLLLTLPAAI
tara:strand:+ start:447 stop:1532 length:1086 start_codon:yes stop_codon:yes gene_type:complete